MGTQSAGQPRLPEDQVGSWGGHVSLGKAWPQIPTKLCPVLYWVFLGRGSRLFHLRLWWDPPVSLPPQGLREGLWGLPGSRSSYWF